MSTDRQVAARHAFNMASNGMFKETHRRQKLTSHQRQEIIDRYQDGETGKALALEFGVTANYINLLAGPRR